MSRSRTRSQQHHRTLRLEMLESRELLTVNMSPQEQLMIELVNRARADPDFEASLHGVPLNDEVGEDSLISSEPKQPLAPDQALTTAAGLHSEDMLRRNYFGHDTPDGVTPSDRARSAGYPTGAGENIAWYGDTRAIDREQEVYGRHEGLFLSVGHRINMMRENWREIGAGVRYGTFTQAQDGSIDNYQSIMVGTLFGDRGGNYFITGVAIDDSVFANNFYEMGEGLGSVNITAVNQRTGESYTDVTGSTGGYGVQVPAGVYTITASGGEMPQSISVSGVEISNKNRKLDFNTNGMPLGDIGGTVYHDQNGNGLRGGGDLGIGGRIVFLDLNDDGIANDHEPQSTTDQSGSFQFANLLPGEYFVRQVVPERWLETEPQGTIIATLRGNNDALGIAFGSQPILMSPQEQLLIELINRARNDPAAEAARFGIDLNRGIESGSEISAVPKPPLAVHRALVEAAGLHATDMLERDYFGHTSPEGTDSGDRARAAGYPVDAGENIIWLGNNAVDRDAQVYSRHEASFFHEGHRANLLRESWREVGSGIRYGVFTQTEDGVTTDFNAIMISSMFGNRGANPFITGVAINDLVEPNDFYEIGEGMGGVIVTATNKVSGRAFTVTTSATGGYSIQLPNGVYHVAARGGGLRNTIVVDGVYVDGANRKVDFNSRKQPTGDIGGIVFRDVHADGLGSEDQLLADRTVYIDFNDNGVRDVNDWSTTTNGSGSFRFENLLAGNYTVRQQMPAGWRHTVSEPDVVELDGTRNMLTLQFGSQPIPQPPSAQGDTLSANVSQSASIDVLRNDSDPDNDIDPRTLEIATAPRFGSLSMAAATGVLSYTPNAGYQGEDSFVYTVADEVGLRSNQATVRITVSESISFRNPGNPYDVDDSGSVVSLDALLIIRELQLHGAGPLADRGLPAGPPYLDVNGDGFVTSIDALQVIRDVHVRRVASSAARVAAIAAALDVEK